MRCAPPIPYEKMTDLEKRYLQARGVYFACNDEEASRLAQAIINDAACPRVAAAPAPTNRPPTARLTVPPGCEADVVLNLSGEGSRDPDNDRLTYKWDFGDGTTATFDQPTATHRYARAGNYTARLMVDDGRGGTDVATVVVSCTRRVVLQESAGRVLFDFDKATLKPEGQKLLAGVVQEMKENQTLRADLVGHTDSIGTDAYNQRLSVRRAEAVRNFLVSQGIAANRLTVTGKGKSDPVAPNTTAEGRAQNRRVEITLRPMTVQ